jgi:sucrose phosphorylase
MDVNAQSEAVWVFYDETLSKLRDYGCKIVRLDAFAYLHKEVGSSNFFNRPGTWNYLERIRKMAETKGLSLLPEIHAEYGSGLHEEVASKGFLIYDFFLPGLILHTLETGSKKALLKWAREIQEKGYKTINMLGCHDGIPLLDLKGKEVNGAYKEGLLEDEEIENLLDTILRRGGRIKNLYDPNGRKISYYQVNATYFSALGEDPRKLLLARAIQLFMPGTPQIWYLDLFAGKNDYAAADKLGKAGHKEINRTNLTLAEIELTQSNKIVKDQLTLLRVRNSVEAFDGVLTIHSTDESLLDVEWRYGNDKARLRADLNALNFEVDYWINRKRHHLTFS